MSNLKLIATLGLLLLTGCSSLAYDPNRPLDRYLDNYQISLPSSSDRFTTCNLMGCRGQAEVSLSDRQWQQIKNQFRPEAENAVAEREQIANAIGLLEQLIGPQNNTYADQACNNFSDPLESHQLDCIAEATNTTVYLQLLQQNQLLRWHLVSYPAKRQIFIIFVPHHSAVILQRDNGALFAVDSWFRANGERATVVPLQLWRNNYYPASCR